MKRWTALVGGLLMAMIATGVMLLLETPKSAEASHFRSAQLSWTKGTGNTAQFKSTVATRATFFYPSAGDAQVGDTIFPVQVDLGDGNSASPAHTVVAVDATNDWILTEGTFSHAYAGAGPYTVGTESCCRLSPPQHINNPDGGLRAETIVDFSATTANPVSSISPIVDCAKEAVCQFTVPAVDPDNQSVRFRLATSQEAAGIFGPFTQPGAPHAPNDAQIDPNTGVYKWDTSGATLAPAGFDTYYSTQVVIENVVGNQVVTKTAVDFFIRLSGSPNQAPEFDSPPTPADGTVLSAQVGTPVTFDVSAHDDDLGDQVTLGMQGKPSGATFNTAVGNAATGQFSWTPTSVGSTILTLTAQDQKGLGATQRSVTINVIQGPNGPPQVDAGGDVSGDEGSNIALHGTGSDPDNDTLSYAWTYKAGADVDTAATCWFGDPSAADTTINCTDDGTYTATLTADDHVNSPVSESITVAVNNVVPQITNLSSSSSQVLTGKSVTFTGTATDASSVDQGAGFNWEWSFDNGATYTPGSGTSNQFTKTFSSCGTYNVKATATDKDGGKSDAESLSSNPIQVYNATFRPPLDGPATNLTLKGKVLPVKISVECDGQTITGLSPTIKLINGDVQPGAEGPDDVVEAYSASAADTTGVMRPVDGGYLYNLQVPGGAAVSVGQKFTVRVNPFGPHESNPDASMYALLEIKK
jgi:hypothetical protein